MEKYVFHEMTSSKFAKDPVFKTSDFKLFGNPGSISNDPYLFEIYLKQRRFKYCLTEPNKTIDNETLLLKVKRYLLAHEDNEDFNKPVNTYFIGEMEKSVDIASEFENQNIIYVTIGMVEQWYPKSPNEIIKKVVEAFFKIQKYLGQLHRIGDLSEDELFVDPKLSDSEKGDYRRFIEGSLEKEGLAVFVSGGLGTKYFTLTNKAIELVDNKNVENNKIAFIAIKFDSNEKRINAIQDAIASAGFEPRIMSQVETNNWIMPEIFYQIKNARFIVADFSLPCDGAYYEAGYAAALEKPVIHLFDKREETETNKLHFDIAQKSTIFYTDFDDLKKRLSRRIEATIK